MAIIAKLMTIFLDKYTCILVSKILKLFDAHELYVYIFNGH